MLSVKITPPQTDVGLKLRLKLSSGPAPLISAFVALAKHQILLVFVRTQRGYFLVPVGAAEVLRQPKLGLVLFLQQLFFCAVFTPGNVVAADRIPASFIVVSVELVILR